MDNSERALSERIDNFLARHELVIWRDTWNCKCSGWALGSELNSQEQMNKSWRGHLFEVVEREPWLREARDGKLERLSEELRGLSAKWREEAKRQFARDLSVATAAGMVNVTCADELDAALAKAGAATREGGAGG